MTNWISSNSVLIQIIFSKLDDAYPSGLELIGTNLFSAYPLQLVS